MNILHINSYIKGGGAETVFNYTREIHSGLINNYYGCVENSHTNEQTDIKFYTWENDFRLLGVTNYIFSIKNYNLLSSFLLRHKIDIIHIHGFFSSLSPSILFAIKKFKKKQSFRVIQTLHDFHLICPNSSLFNFNKNIICEKCIGRKYKLHIFKENCDRRGYWFSFIKGVRSLVSNNILLHRDIIDQFIVPSNFLKNKLIEDKVDKAKIILIRNPIRINDYAQKEKKENLICYFGRLSLEKNIDFLINAFSIWKENTKNNFRLLLIGQGEKGEELKQFVNTNRFKKDIIFIDHLPQKQLFEKIRKAKYFSLTSKCFENFPMSIIEAITLNIIPIVPNIGGMHESVKDFLEIGMSYENNNIKSWCESLNYLERNYSDEINSLLERKIKLMDELNIDIYAENILKLYSDNLI